VNIIWFRTCVHAYVLGYCVSGCNVWSANALDTYFAMRHRCIANAFCSEPYFDSSLTYCAESAVKPQFNQSTLTDSSCFLGCLRWFLPCICLNLHFLGEVYWTHKAGFWYERFLNISSLVVMGFGENFLSNSMPPLLVRSIFLLSKARLCWNMTFIFIMCACSSSHAC